MSKRPTNILVSRTDSIGDVVLTLPVAKVIKDNFPDSGITFLVSEYTIPVAKACENIDAVISKQEFLSLTASDKIKFDTIIHAFPVKAIALKAKKLKIPCRAGTSHRYYHITTCNKLVHFGRKNSELHESQLNLKLLKALKIKSDYGTDEIKNWFGLKIFEPPESKFIKLLSKEKYNLIIHPKSKGNAREWDLHNFVRLINSLDRVKFNIFITGSDDENESFYEIKSKAKSSLTVITSSEMNLSQFISFIKNCDGMLANSTGPLHIAAALGKDAIGIYPPIRPMHPGRWAPLGKKVQVFVADKKCNDCRNKPNDCHCINEIKPDNVRKTLYNLYATKFINHIF